MIREYDLTIARAMNQVQMPASAKVLGVYSVGGGTSLKVVAYGQAGIWTPREFTMLTAQDDFTPEEIEMGFRVTDWIGTVVIPTILPGTRHSIGDGALIHVFMLPPTT